MSDLKAELEAAYSDLRSALERRDLAAFNARSLESFDGPPEAWTEAAEMMAEHMYPSLDQVKFLTSRGDGSTAGYYVLEQLDDPNFVTVAVVWFLRGPDSWKVHPRRFGSAFPRDPDPAKSDARVQKELQENPGFQRPPGAEPPPHPMKLGIDAATLKAEFMRATIDICPDPQWQYGIAFRTSCRLRPNIGGVPPTPAAPVQSVGLLYRPDLEADLEVIGVQLLHEVDPRHWLEEWLRFNGVTPASWIPYPLVSGITGDATGTWEADGAAFAGRWATMKVGARMFVLCCRGKTDIYRKVANDFFLALAEFKPVVPGQSPLSENVLTMTGPGWKTYFTESWKVHHTTANGFQLVATPPAPDDARAVSCHSAFPGAPERPRPGYPPESWNCNLNATFGPAEEVGSVQNAEESVLESLRKAGMELEGGPFSDEQPKGQWESSRLWVGQARVQGVPGADVRCRVAQLGSTWLLSAVVGYPREANPHAWMRNVRALDLVAQTTELG